MLDPLLREEANDRVSEELLVCLKVISKAHDRLKVEVRRQVAVVGKEVHLKELLHEHVVGVIV